MGLFVVVSNATYLVKVDSLIFEKQINQPNLKINPYNVINFSNL